MPNRKFTPRRNFLKISISTGLTALGGFAFAQSFPFMAKKFEWLPSECADERYPMQLIEGTFYSDNRPIAKVPAGKITDKGWGAPGSIHIVGPTFKAVPERLDLSWFSFTEDQFFEGTIPLPKKAITALFNEGFKDTVTGAQETWTKILVGMGLGGWTSVWLLGGGGIVREIARIQLKPTQLNWARVLDNPAIERSAFIRTTLQRRLSKSEIDALEKHGPPVSTWPRYAQRYRWRIDVAGKHAPLYMFLRSFNGERQGYDFVRSPPGVLETVPKNIQITWLSNKGHKLLSEIHLDESEVYDALDQANAAASNMTTTLRIAFDARYQISIVLESQAIRIPLTRSRVEVSSYGT